MVDKYCLMDQVYVNSAWVKNANFRKKNQPKHAPAYELLVSQGPAPTAFGTNFYDVYEISRFLSELSKIGRSSA